MKAYLLLWYGYAFTESSTVFLEKFILPVIPTVEPKTIDLRVFKADIHHFTWMLHNVHWLKEEDGGKQHTVADCLYLSCAETLIY